MFERWKKHYSFVDDVNIITKLLLGVAPFIFIIFVHNFDYMIYITIIMFLFLMAFNGTQFKITGAFILATVLFALLSSLFMILTAMVHICYLNGALFKLVLKVLYVACIYHYVQLQCRCLVFYWPSHPKLS